MPPPDFVTGCRLSWEGCDPGERDSSGQLSQNSWRLSADCTPGAGGINASLKGDLGGTSLCLQYLRQFSISLFYR